MWNIIIRTASIVAALSSLSYPAVIFDNADPPLAITNRISSIEGAAAYLVIGPSPVVINQIAVNAQPLEDGQVKFVIFSDSSSPGGTSGSLLYSDTITVTAANAFSYLLSEPLNFTLEGGRYYDIGAIFSGTAIRYTYDFTGDVENGITSLVSTQNIDDFAAPRQAGHGGVSDLTIRLYGPAAPAPEPGPALLSVAGLSLAAAVSLWKRREAC